MAAFVTVALSETAVAQQLPSAQQGLPAPAATPSAKKNAKKLPSAPPDSYSPQGHPAPTPTPKPGQFDFSGRLRGFQFNRINTPLTGQNNRRAYEFGFAPHIAYHFAGTPFTVGYTYSGATGFGLNGPNPVTNNAHVDNTVPGFPLNQEASELYGQYQDKIAYISVGNRVLNYAFAPNSDSRITPVSYQNIDTNFNLGKYLSVGATRIVRWEMRNASTFTPYTLLTGAYSEASPLAAFNYPHSFAETPGVLRLAANYHPSGRFVGLAENYQFYQLENLTYFEGRYALNPYSPVNPYIAVQSAFSQKTGRSYLGIIDNQTYGLQVGANIAPGLQAIVSSDIMPWHYAIVKAKSSAAAGAPYFLPAGGTSSVQKISKGVYRVAYGGLASPYTDSLATDPLYTTQITQGMADRRSAGNSYKAALIYTTHNKQAKLIASEAQFDYSNIIARNKTWEFNLDGTYFLNKVRPGPYKGLFVRVRLAPRTTPTLPYNFEYQRFITEYDF